jgi:tetratricopeptide (TPR) repeat protein
LGDVLRAQGDPGGALAAYQDAFPIAKRLAGSDPSIASWQRNLAVIQSKLGDVLRARGDLGGALAAYRDTLAVVKRLAADDPSNAEWQRDSSVGLSKLGDVLLAQGDLGEALAAYRDSLAIAECLATADPSNAKTQRDLASNYVRIAAVSEMSGASDDLEWWRKAHDVLTETKRRGLVLSPQEENSLALIKDKMAGLG